MSEWRTDKESELQESVARLLGYEKLPPPAYPAWQRPTKDGTEGLSELPPWSKNIMYAWLLVDIMIENGFFLEMRTPNLFGEPFWIRVLEMNVRDGYVAFGAGPTMPIAICNVFFDWRKKFRSFSHDGF